MLLIIGVFLLFAVGGGLALAALTRSRQRGGGKFTIVGAVLGFVVGGVLALAAFFAGLGALESRGEGDEMGHLAFALMIFFTVPVFLLGSIMGTTTGALVGGRIDRRRGKESIVRKVLAVPFLVSGALCVFSALPAIILGASSLDEDPETGWFVIGLGIAPLAVGAALCFAGWRVGRKMPSQVKQAERRLHG